MSTREKDMITDWSAEGGVNPETSQAASPPGLGKFLLKVGKKPGIPFRVQLTTAELLVNDTNKAWKAAGDRARSSASRVLEVDQDWAAV